MDKPNFLLGDPFWWPIQLSDRETAAALQLYRRIKDNPPKLDFEKADAASAHLSIMMKSRIAKIVQRDSLPNLAHIINGWGNGVYAGRPLISLLGSFVQDGDAGSPLILQCDPEGDFHPWQSLAYAVMAGVGADEDIPGACFSLRDLACHSRFLNTSDGIELGHLLFAIATLDPDVGGPPFSLKGNLFDLAQLMDHAVQGHHYGGFDVCRKFHLTEGICAAAAQIKGLEDYREYAQGYLDGQLDMLLLLATILDEITRNPHSNLIPELRSDLAIGRFVENHYYYAGHIIELVVFAHSAGYRIPSEYWAIMAYVANSLNELLPTFIENVQFSDYFLHFGHFRRGITLFEQIEKSPGYRNSSSLPDLTAYAVDFDEFDPLELGNPPGQSNWNLHQVYDIASSPLTPPRPEFQKVIEIYSEMTPLDLALKGDFGHFRRVCPPCWPRALHYEFLDYGDQVGVEIHLESNKLIVMRQPIQDLLGRVQCVFPDQMVEWDSNWWRKCGRLRVLFDRTAASEIVAAGMTRLIENTVRELDPLARRISMASS